MLNNKWPWGIYNESRNLRTNGHAEKLVVEVWQPIGMLENVYMGGDKVKFCDIGGLEVADVMALYFGEYCFLYSVNLPMVLMNLEGCHSLAGKLFDTAQCGV